MEEIPNDTKHLSSIDNQSLNEFVRGHLISSYRSRNFTKIKDLCTWEVQDVYCLPCRLKFTLGSG